MPSHSAQHSRTQIAVVGGSQATTAVRELARDVGRRIATAGATLLTGGGEGVMRAACEGAREQGGRTVAIRPDTGAVDTTTAPSKDGASDPIADYHARIWTGLGQARNVVLVLSADAVIAVGGEWGTLSEIALAIKHGKPVVLLESWRVHRPDGSAPPEILTATDPEGAVRAALEGADYRQAGYKRAD